MLVFYSLLLLIFKIKQDQKHLGQSTLLENLPYRVVCYQRETVFYNVFRLRLVKEEEEDARKQIKSEEALYHIKRFDTTTLSMIDTR